ncbi:hypothetical protein [Methylacidiphilum sp. Yel]|uniref:hypothetical protein n=1 Tax=Methylacidiphilum sp. Yel TaxID=1847730 RepID=UPI00141B1987|nr:hypothetical protein [Methylacidiphilum sp. Yel]
MNFFFFSYDIRFEERRLQAQFDDKLMDRKNYKIIYVKLLVYSRSFSICLITFIFIDNLTKAFMLNSQKLLSRAVEGLAL